MKYLTLTVLVAGYLTGRTKSTGKVCSLIAIEPPTIVFELVDRSQRYLLDPKTPGHYDTTEIKKLNLGRVTVISAKNNYWHPGLIGMVMPFAADNYQYINLNASDVDTVYTKYNTKRLDNCNLTWDYVDV